MSEGPLLYDDYFSGSDVELVIEYGGRKLPFRVKKSLTIDEKQVASDVGVSITIDENGKPLLNKLNQAAYSKQIVLIGVREWPFVYQNGTPVPINKDTVSKLDGGLLEKLATAILNQRNVQVAALVPFGEKSGVPS